MIVRWIIIMIGSLTLAACCSKTPLGDYVFPDKASAAAAISDVLGFYTFKVKEPRIEGDTLHWKEQYHEPEMLWKEEQFDLRSITSIDDPAKSQNGWKVTIRTNSDIVSFECETEKHASHLANALGYFLSHKISR